MMADKKTILLVDDEVHIVEMIRLKLEHEGYNIITAVDGKEALEKAQSSMPDLILLDVMMPQLNGYQVCRELKKADKTKSIPIVMVTAKTQESDKFWGLETGADDYVCKPFEFSDLVAIVKKYCPL